jgi:probable HAF family extracellular repeat protein
MIASTPRRLLAGLAGGATFLLIAAGFFPVNQEALAEWGGVGGMSAPAGPQVLNPTATDTDGDGMPNTWEDTYLLNKNNPADARSDFDLDGLTALEEYELNSIHSEYGKPLGKWTAVALPRPTGFTTATPPVTLIECASNGIIVARVTGRLTGTTTVTSYPYIYTPATGDWTRIAAPPVDPPVNYLYPLDVNSSGQVVGYFDTPSGAKGFLWTPGPSGGSTEIW